MQTYRFGEFELDVDAQELRSGPKSLHLERRPLALLALLVRSHGKLVSRDDLIAALWPENVIIDFDAGINTLVRKVRHALGDDSDHPRFVATVPGRGYRFVAPVEKVAEPAANASDPDRRARAGGFLVPAVLSLLVVAGTAALMKWPPDDEPRSGTRIAVMPFENLTGDDSLGYLASGLAEETGVSLSRIELPNFSVIGGMSARNIAAENLPLRQAGRELDADYLVLSSLRRDASRIRVTSRLVHVPDDEQVWSASFDRELTNVLGVQRELSIAIAEQVRQQLSPEVAAAIDRRQTRSPEAYELYLKGRFAWTQFAPDSVPRALEFYQQAVALDPRYALAWAGIAHALSTSTMTADARPDAIELAAQDALERALEYGPDLAEVHLAAEVYHMFIEWDFAAAEAAGRRAVALDQNNGLAHMVLGIVLSERSKFVEAIQMQRRARELDPFFALIFANSANVAIASGDPRTGMELSQQAIAINPEFWVGYLHLGNALVWLGDMDGALAAFEACERYSGGNSKPIAARAVLLANQGRASESRALLGELATRTESEFVPALSFAVIYSALGETDEAFAWLEKAWDEHDVHLIAADADWQLMPLRGDPRFQSLMERCQCGRAQLRAAAAVSAIG
jgi:TolB-like protein/DNA-binding winged helix-turn-helix (wHTH) protein/Tfp pilus assembly protein PilF